MQVRTIPSTGVQLPVVGLGTWQTFDVGNDITQRAACAETLAAFVRSGGRVVDSSPMYGSSEGVVGDLLRDAALHPRVWLATKVWTSGERAGIDQMETSMRRLRVTAIDLTQVHNLVDWEVHLRTLRRWKDAGRVRHIGITHYQASSHDALQRVIERESIDTLQVNFSLDEPEAARALLGACARRGVAVIANRPFGGGQSFRRARDQAVPAWARERGIATWAQFMLAWILSHEEVTCAIPGTRQAAHAIDNLGAGRIPPLDVATRRRMEGAWRAL